MICKETNIQRDHSTKNWLYSYWLYHWLLDLHWRLLPLTQCTLYPQSLVGLPAPGQDDSCQKKRRNSTAPIGINVRELKLTYTRTPSIEVRWRIYASVNWLVSSLDHVMAYPLVWRHNGRDGVSTHQPHDCLLNLSCRCRSKKTSKLRVTGLCAWNSPVAGEFPAQMASNAENVSIWWRHHALVQSQFIIWSNGWTPSGTHEPMIDPPSENFKNFAHIQIFSYTKAHSKWSSTDIIIPSHSWAL